MRTLTMVNNPSSVAFFCPISLSHKCKKGRKGGTKKEKEPILLSSGKEEGKIETQNAAQHTL